MRLVGVPIKAFGAGKGRLAGVLDPQARAELGRRVAGHTLTVAAALTDVVVVTDDDDVRAWAVGLGYRCLGEGAGGLDGAAAVVAAAAPDAWAVLHADLPRLAEGELARALAVAGGGGWAIAPSHDGGTSLVAGSGDFSFSYGVGSFHRHLARAPHATVVVAPGLALDLDTPADLAALGNHPLLTGVA